ncbi:MAG: hypothetical protein JKY82_12900 [Rhizobiaceae bacterium]|nr:hypothetical protein [Rhizobiaceae bacterium]
MTDDNLSKMSDMQWYMLRSKNPVYLAIHFQEKISKTQFEDFARSVLAGAPGLAVKHATATDTFVPIDPEEIIKASTYSEVSDLSASWGEFLSELPDFFDHPNPIASAMRCYYSQPKNGSSEKCETLIITSAMHAVVEGMDASRVLQGKQVQEFEASQQTIKSGVQEALYLVAGGVMAIGHHALARLTFRPKRVPIVRHVRIERRGIKAMARKLGVSRKALLFSLATNGLESSDSKTGFLAKILPVSLAYTVYPNQMDVGDDRRIKLRVRTAWMRQTGGLKVLAKKFNALFKKQMGKPYFFQRLNNMAIRVHRQIEKVLPVLYGDTLFRYLTFSVCYTLLPPIALTGKLAGLRGGEILCGSITTGTDVLSFCPSGDAFIIAFDIDSKQLSKIDDCVQYINAHGLEANRVQLEQSW